jgi:spermidine synthase
LHVDDGPIPPGSSPRQQGAAGTRLALILFFLSGAVGLVYQVVWLRELTLVFGSTAYASSAVLSTFMGGLALGSLWAGHRADRWHWSPLRSYGVLELGIAAYAALIPLLLRGITPLLGAVWRLGGERHFALFGLVKFAAIAVLILPATTLMGATLPVLARLARSLSSSFGGAVGALYASNTFGAVVGTVLAGFVVLPRLGMTRTLAFTVAVNACVGATAWAHGRAPGGDVAAPPAAPTKSEKRELRTVVVVFAVSGFAAMVLEVAWTRGLALVLGSSVYAYAAMLTAFLVGLASGAAVAARWLARRRRSPAAALAIVLAAAGIFAYATAAALQALPWVFAEIYFRLSPGPNAWLAAEVALCLVIMFPTTFLLGWIFPLVLEIAGASRGIASSVGRVYAANTFGTIAGAAVGGFVAIPVLGVANTLAAVAAAQLLLGAVVAVAGGEAPGRLRVFGVACAAGAALCLVIRPAWDVRLMNSGVYMNVQNFERSAGWKGFLEDVRSDNQLVYAKDGLTATVMVARQPRADNLYLAVNGKVDASSREDLETQIMAGHLPLLLHPDPRDVLVVGLASGITVGSVATHPVDRIRVVEVEAAMVGAARCFAEANGNVLDDPRVELSINDARNELEFRPATYDVIVSEPSNPWMTVASNLFTEEFFGIAKARLRPGGVFGQWIQTYCLAPELVRSILAAFHRSFPHVLVFETLDGVDLLVVGSDRPLRFDRPEIAARMSELRVRIDLGRVGVQGPDDMLAMLQTGGASFDRLVAGARRNTDDNGLVEFAAPKSLYLDSQDANIAMLQQHQDDPLEPVLAATADEGPVDPLRMEMLRRWIARDERPRAAKAAPFFTDPVLRAEAEKALAGSLLPH